MRRVIKKRRSHPHCRRALKYAHDVVSGKIPNCRLVIAACQRFIDDLSRKPFPFTYNKDRAERFCNFVELFKHVKGKWAGTPFKLEPFQSFIFCNLFGWEDKDGLRRFRRAYVKIPRKNGKGLALDTPIPTPTGWTTMGDIQNGDILYDERGNECVVTFVSDHKNIDCYEVTFSNGEKITCDGDHLWETTAKVDNPGSTKEYPRIKTKMKKVRDTRDLFRTQRYGKRGDTNHSINMPSPVIGTEMALPIDPYLLGVWLGDGSSSGAKISCGSEDIDEMYLAISSLGYPIRKKKDRTCWTIILSDPAKINRNRNDSLHHKLRMLGVLENKHIPEIYLRASIDQRLAMLQGLMDTDGTCDRQGRAQEFASTRIELTTGFCELLASLGIKYSVREKPLRCNGVLVKGIGYYVQFCMHRDTMPVFRLKRKLERQKYSTERSCSPRSRSVQIVSVTKVDTVTTKCIQVDSPNHQFLCGRTMIPTHNTLMAIPIGLGMLTIEAEPGAEVYCGATSEDQADEVFRPAKAMVERAPEFKEAFNVSVSASSIYREEGLSFFKRLIGKPGEGQSPYCAIHDEYHEHKTSDQVDSMDTGMGARQEPLQFIITTAGKDTSSPCKELEDYAANVLEGHFENERLFSVIYGVDPEDKWEDFEVWKKANPNFGVSVSEEYLRGKLSEAIQRTSMQNTVKTKHLNMWVNAGVGWTNMAKWNENGDTSLTIEQFKDCSCWIGIDLASKIDLTAMMVLVYDDGVWYLFGKYYLPRDTIELPGNEHYQRWEDEGWLVGTPGARTDYAFLEEDLLEIYGTLKVEELVYDPREAEYLMQTIREKVSCPVVEMTQSAAVLSEPMKEFEAQIESGNLKHNGDPVLAWAAGNVMLKEARNKLYYPAKANVASKIDPIVAAIMAMARAKATVDDLETSQAFVEL